MNIVQNPIDPRDTHLLYRSFDSNDEQVVMYILLYVIMDNLHNHVIQPDPLVKRGNTHIEIIQAGQIACKMS